MGIKGLSKLIAEHAASGFREDHIKNYFGRKVAIDASMSLYQFLIAVRAEGAQLTNDSGQTTSHLMGFFYRTIRMIENGIKPVYVFDGKPPTLKSGELAKRTERRADAQKGLDAAKEDGNADNVEKFERRLVKVLPEHNQQAMSLLKYMGVPYIEAPCEAEAQCAEMAKAGKVFGVATEDMDALTFGSTVLLRHLTFSEARKMPIQEYHIDNILSELEMTIDEFIDLCILLGCDYCDSIRGIGPHRAILLIKEHRSIEEIIKHLDTKKFTIPENWPFEDARLLFKKPDVIPASEIKLKWTAPDEEALVNFMVNEHGFDEDRIRKGIKKLTAQQGKAVQGRLDSFFKVIPADLTATKKAKAPAKMATGKAGKKSIANSKSRK